MNDRLFHENLGISDERAAEILIDVYRLHTYTYHISNKVKKLIEKYDGAELALAVLVFAWNDAIDQIARMPYIVSIEHTKLLNILTCLHALEFKERESKNFFLKAFEDARRAAKSSKEKDKTYC